MNHDAPEMNGEVYVFYGLNIAPETVGRVSNRRDGSTRCQEERRSA